VIPGLLEDVGEADAGDTDSEPRTGKPRNRGIPDPNRGGHCNKKATEVGEPTKRRAADDR
jgi:hypothetical protein